LKFRRPCEEPGLEALLGDEIMEPVLRSAKLTRRKLNEIALRLYIAAC
jgi:hypothetical protein